VTTMMRTLAIALAAAAVGCMGGGRGHARAPAGAAEPSEPPAEAATPPAEATAAGPAAGPMAGCAMAVPGAEVAVTDVPAGAALEFTTPSEQNVAELRTRVHAMAEMHEAHHGEGAMAGGMHGEMHGAVPPGGSAGSGGTGSGAAPEHAVMMPPSTRAVAEEVEGGARIVITAEDPADIERVRSAARMHAAHWREFGTCELEPEHPGSR
jgi:hypothetical protein